MAEVQRRLEARFPELDPAVVAAAIRVAAAGITGPVRDYVPLLVERAARERLDQAVAGGGTAPVEQGRPEPDPAVSPG
ncbi:MAG: three-helix bundle dimerization domain-containing protein [Ornithinibacter sp.]